MTLAEHDMCTGLDTKELATLNEMLEPRHYAQGATIVRQAIAPKRCSCSGAAT